MRRLLLVLVTAALIGLGFVVGSLVQVGGNWLWIPVIAALKRHLELKHSKTSFWFEQCRHDLRSAHIWEHAAHRLNHKLDQVNEAMSGLRKADSKLRVLDET